MCRIYSRKKDQEREISPYSYCPISQAQMLFSERNDGAREIVQQIMCLLPAQGQPWIDSWYPIWPSKHC